MFRKIFRPEFIFFILFLFIGLFIYDDYGLSFDEAVQRSENGYVNYNYILTGNDSVLRNSPEKYHGPAFEIFLVFIEKAFNLTDDRDIFLNRHLCTFLLFFAGVIFFYLLARNYFNSKTAALFSCVMLVLSPRIFAESFYNCKDIAFLSVFIISIYFLTRFLKKQDFFSASLHALFTGILIDIRITGVIVPVFTVIFFLADKNFKVNTEKLITSSAYLLQYLFLSGIFIALFWPVLWKDTVTHFMAALSEMSKFPWHGDVMYMGKVYLADDLPWHYLPVWIFISTPFIYCILFCSGVLFIAIRLLKSPVKFYKEERESLIFFSWFFVPLFTVILLGSVVYDGWRHLYFIYPAFVLLAVRGFYWLINFFGEKGYVVGTRILKAATVLSVIYGAVIIIISHPYQNVYFNFLAGNPEGKFERDYWGLSFRTGLEHILEADTSRIIMFTGSNSDVALNWRILPQKDRDRLVYTNYFEFADYYLDNFRWNRWVNQPVEEVFSLRPMNAKIMSVYKVRHNKSDETLLMMENDFEKNYPGWNSVKDTLIGTAAHSGSKVCMIGSNNVYNVGISVPYDSLTSDMQALAVFASLQTLLHETDSVPLIVISVNNLQGKDSYWKAAKLNTLENNRKKWQRIIFEVEIPEDIVTPNQLKAYIWNPFKGRMYIDDFTLKIVKAH